MEFIFFIIFSLLIVGSALMVALTRKAMHAMLWLVVCFLATACLFFLLKAEFVAAVQVMVYAGGILILYMFAIMMVDIRRFRQMTHFHANKPTILVVGILIFAELAFLVVSKTGFHTPLGNMMEETAQWGGNAELVGKMLFTDFILPFELVAIVLLVAIVGAVVLGKIRSRSSLMEK